jgi:phosphosulfolactate synthase (CoM biosynthesis protein A)
MKITKEQFEKFSKELKEFGFNAVLRVYDDFESVSIHKGLEFVSEITSSCITFYCWGIKLNLSEKCNILKIAAKYFKE